MTTVREKCDALVDMGAKEIWLTAEERQELYESLAEDMVFVPDAEQNTATGMVYRDIPICLHEVYER